MSLGPAKGIPTASAYWRHVFFQKGSSQVLKCPAIEQRGETGLFRLHPLCGEVWITLTRTSDD